MSVSYSAVSPYYLTNTYGDYLDVMTNRDIPASPDDQLITISSVYHQRPDLMAYDLYTDTRLWWIFAVRNPNTLEDPVFDFTAGTQIYVPTRTSVTTSLGL